MVFKTPCSPLYALAGQLALLCVLRKEGLPGTSALEVV
jgi:hypothetical protein